MSLSDDKPGVLDNAQLAAAYDVLWGCEDVDPLVGTCWRARDYYLVPVGHVVTVVAVVQRNVETASVVMNNGDRWNIPKNGRDHEQAQRVLPKLACDSSCGEDMIRAAGDVVCDECGLPYRKHPHCRGHFDRSTQSYWLRVLCNGTHVKL